MPWAIVILLPMALPIIPRPVRATTAADLCGAQDNPCVVARQIAVTDGSVLDVGTRELRIAAGGALNVQSGLMSIRAGTLTVQAQGSLLGNGSSTVRGAMIDVEADHIVIQGTISAQGADPGGRVELTSMGDISVSGSINASSLSGGDSGGTVILTGGTVVVSGPIIAQGGASAEEAPLGGSITLQAAGDVSVSSTVDASGVEGGFIEIFTGVFPSGAGGGTGPTLAGNIAITNGAQILADSRIAPGAGGDIEFDASGDGTATGNLTIGGLVSVVGRTGSFDSSGGEGGSMDFSAVGDIIIAETATLDARGGGPDGCGGMIDLTTEIGILDSAAQILIRSSGSESEGGALTCDINDDVNFRGTIDATAATGGEVNVDSVVGAATFTGVINVNSSTSENGDGGTISIGSFDEPEAVIVRGTMSANANAQGDGGGIELSGIESVQINARLTVNTGPDGNGRAGSVTITAVEGSVVIDARIDGIGTGPNSSGGTVSVDAQTGISLLQQIDVRGQGGSGKFCRITGTACQNNDNCPQGDSCATAGGGAVAFSSTGPVDVLANVLASSTAGGGGRVDVISEDDVRLSGNMTTDGNREPGGVVDALGCSVVVCGFDACPAGGVGVLSSRGPSGANRLRGRGRVNSDEPVVTVLGSMRSDNTGSGGNFLVWAGTPPVFRPAVIVTTNVTPAAREQIDATLLPCPVCGNGTTEAPEACDDGNQLDGDGCSSVCQFEGDIVRGDVNGDLAVNDADVCDLITEIFDGDGDSVGSVNSRDSTFPGRPGADANDDTRINAADITATIGLRQTPTEACAPCLGRIEGLCQ